jgi:hypothetical protein
MNGKEEPKRILLGVLLPVDKVAKSTLEEDTDLLLPINIKGNKWAKS